MKYKAFIKCVVLSYLSFLSSLLLINEVRGSMGKVLLKLSDTLYAVVVKKVC